MSIFSPPKSKITMDEFKKKIRPSLSTKGFSHKEIDKVEMFFGGDLSEPEATQRGIDRKELESTIKRMEENPHVHGIPEHKISILKEVMEKHL